MHRMLFVFVRKHLIGWKLILLLIEIFFSSFNFYLSYYLRPPRGVAPTAERALPLERVFPLECVFPKECVLPSERLGVNVLLLFWVEVLFLLLVFVLRFTTPLVLLVLLLGRVALVLLVFLLLVLGREAFPLVFPPRS